jgi:hypothetical protein
MTRLRVPAIVALLAAGLAAGSAAADPLGVGGALPELRLPDQHGQERSVPPDVRVVLFSRDMKGGGAIRELLEKDGAAFLAEHSAVYVADVSRMPGVIRAAIAKPRMRRRSYPVLLDEAGAATAPLPSASGRATAIFVEQGRITRVEHVDTVEALRALLAPSGS